MDRNFVLNHLRFLSFWVVRMRSTTLTDNNLLFGSLRWRNETNLLHQAQMIALAPDFGHLALYNSVNVDESPGHTLSGGCRAHEHPFVSPAQRQPLDDAVAFGNQFLGAD